MPTGYTRELEKLQDPFDWLAMIIPRAFMYCVRLKEERLDKYNTPEELKEAVLKSLDDAIEGVKQSRAEWRKDLQEFKAKSEADWEEFFDRRYKEAEEHYRERLSEYRKDQDLYDEAFDIAGELAQELGENEVDRTCGKMLNYARDQLLKGGPDEPHLPEAPEDPAEEGEELIEQTERQLTRYNQRLKSLREARKEAEDVFSRWFELIESYYR